MRAVRNLLLAVAVVATFFTTFTGAAAANGGTPSPGQAWIDKAIKEQLGRKPGGVVSGNTVYYAKEDVLLTYTPPASLPTGPTAAAAAAPAIPNDYAGCPTGYVCLYTQTDLAYGSLALRTGSLWCPREQGTNGHLHLSDYGLQGNVRSADSENSFWSQGIWDSWGFFGSQWTMGPYGYLLSVSPNNIWMVDICRYKDFMY